MATEAVYKYLCNQNRPYSANDIVQNLQKEYGKTTVQKSLDELSESGRILEKTYGKQKVYCVMQDDAQNSEEVQKEIRLMEQQSAELQEELSALEEKNRNLDFELKNLVSSLTTEDARKELVRLEEDVGRLRNKYKLLKGNSVAVSEEDKERIENDHKKYMREYRKRKRICMEVTNSILEGYPKKKKDLFEEVGIETDEDVGCVLPK